MKQKPTKTKAQLLKEALKSAIREVMREELRDILREELKGVKPLIEDQTPKKINYQDFLPKPNVPKKQVEFTPPQMGENPLARFLQDTKRNMNSEDYQAITLNSNVIDMPFAVQDTQQFADSIGEMQEWTPTNMKPF